MSKTVTRIPVRKKPKWWRRFLTETAFTLYQVAGPAVGAIYLLYQKATADPKAAEALDAAVKAFADVVATQAQTLDHDKSVAALSTVASAQNGLADYRHMTSGLLVAVVACVWAILFAVAKVLAARQKETQKEADRDPYHLLGPLYVLHSQVSRYRKIGVSDDDRKKFRVTIHALQIEKHKNEHEQCVPYVGYTEDDETKVGRSWSNKCGLIGALVRLESSEPLLGEMGPDVVTEEDYWRELVRLYGYSKKEAKDHEPLRLSSLAIPIKDNADAKGRVIGVVYADSSERGFFDNEVQNLCVITAMAIAKHVHENYPS